MLQIVSPKGGWRGPHPESRFETSEGMGLAWQPHRTGPEPRPGLGRARAPPAGAGARGSGMRWEQKRRRLCRETPESSPAGTGACPHPGDDGACDGEGPKICTSKFGCRTMVHYVISCSAGGRFPSVKIILLCLISQFSKSYC